MLDHDRRVPSRTKPSGYTASMLRRVPSTSANVTRPRTSAVQWQSQPRHPQLPTSHTIGVPPRGSAGRAGCSPCSGSMWARGRVSDRVGQSSFDPRCLGARCRAWTRGSRCVRAEGLLRSRPRTNSRGQSALPAGPAWWVHPITRTCLVQSLPARPTQRGPARHSCVVPRSRLPCWQSAEDHEWSEVQNYAGL